ncbi:MAG: orc1/cdc6 family replication initiation protein [Deltaproteobacteria bacterium]|nr:orc1/cdc6 family replication initiation protein [Deltaproteobacteria bacterium]
MALPEHGPQTELAEKREEFCWVIPWGTTLLKSLEADGVQLTHAHPTAKDHIWLLRLRLPSEIQDAFGTAPEVLLLVVRGAVQARDLERARAELYRAEYRLDLDLLVVSDDQPQLADRLHRMPGRWGQWVPWPGSREAMMSLPDMFREHLPTFDIFEEKNPVRGRGVIGREEEIADLTSRIENAESIGVFGLRKVGKTSVVRAVTDALDPVSASMSMRAQTAEGQSQQAAVRVLACWLDVQRAYDRSARRLYSTLAAEIEKRLSAHGMTIPSPPTDDLQRIDDLIRLTMEKTALPLCIVLDEYDFLFEGSQGQPPIANIAAFLRLLRGWAQQTQRLCVVVIGRDPTPFQSPEVDGFPNPMLGWFVTRWLGPLAPQRANELLSRLGKRVGLDIGSVTLELALSLTGGHPLLHRQFGSSLLEHTNDRPLNSSHLNTDVLCKAAALDFHERGAVREICHEILHLLRTRFQASYDSLVHAARTSPIEALHHASWSSPAVVQLRNFGLFLGSAAKSASIPLVLTVYVRTFERRPSRSSRHRNSNRRGWHR